MFYILVFLGLCYLSYCEYKGKYYKYFNFNITFCFITLIAVFRYGQGTDYFGYMYNYYMTPHIDKFLTVFGLDVHGEIGFTFMYSIFRTFRLSFEFFAGTIALISMLLIYRFIKKYSKMPITSLTLFYVLYYLVYVFSGMRQGLAIAIFVGLGLDLYNRGKLKHFILLVLITATIHSSMLITLLIIPLNKYKVSYKLYVAVIGVMFLFIITKLDLTIIQLLPGFISNKILGYWGEMPISFLALANKTTFLFLILFFSSGIEEDKTTTLFKKLYILGFVLYILTIKSMTISSRISLYFKIFEIVLIPNIIIELSKNSKKFKALQLWGISMAITLVLLIKTLNAFTGEGKYFETVNFVRYPYPTVFNKEKIWEYKEKDYYFKILQKHFKSGRISR